jgi:DNA-binding CsgD family transcriptional regulator
VDDPVSHDAELQLAEISARPGPVHQRAQALLDALHHLLPFDGAWMALAEPGGRGYTPLASADLEGSSVRSLSDPHMARQMRVTGADRDRAPTSLSDLPSSSADLRAWAEHLLPAGFREALSLALFGEGGRHVGFPTLLFRRADPPSPALRRQLTRWAPTLAAAIDPVRSLAAPTAVVRGARAGVILLRDNDVSRVPGLRDDPLLRADSELVGVARDVIGEGRNYATFLWPRGARESPDGYVRATVMAGEQDLEGVACGIALLSPAPRLRGLTHRELEVLGHVIEGCSNMEIARALVVSPRTVAAHLEHVLAKLDAPSRTLAAVRAERSGLYIPLPPHRTR